jgi:hypothetical protein
LYLLASIVGIETRIDFGQSNGIVLNFSGVASNFAFTVGTRDVHGDASTEFFGGSAFPDLHNTVRVNVKGLQRDGFVYAQRIHVDGDSDEDGAIEDSVDPEPDPEPIPPTPVPVTPSPRCRDPIGDFGQCQMWTCGFLFTAQQNVSVQALGQWDENLDGLLTNASVGLWSSDGTLLASVVVPSGTSVPLTAGYRFVAIASVQLVAGRQYVIGSAFAGGGAPVFAAAGLNPALASPAGRVILKGSGVLAFPTSVNSNIFGGGNFLFVPAAP